MNDETEMPNEPDSQEPADGEEISYQVFGEHFIRYLVTVPRLKNELEATLQATVAGSADALPNDLLVLSYQFDPNDLHIDRQVGDEAEIAFELTLSGILSLTVKVMGMPVRLPMEVTLRILVDVRTFAPLTIRLEPRPVRARNVRVTTQMPRELRALPTKLLDRINPLAIAVRDNIVRQINKQLARPELVETATIDVLALANNALGGNKDAGKSSRRRD